jgi:hypothetical protein
MLTFDFLHAGMHKTAQWKRGHQPLSTLIDLEFKKAESRK